MIPCCTLPMRNWNEALFFLLRFFSKRWSVVPYLWEIETFSASLTTFSVASVVVPYLWGIETILGWRLPISLSTMLCCTLPMRNWNFKYVLSKYAMVIVVPYLWGIATFWSEIAILFLFYFSGCTLPMRNWNSSYSFITNSLAKVVPYLWGIETESIVTISPVRSLSCTLPMRNWNIKDFIDDVLISFLLYLTYEELKLCDTTNSNNSFTLHVVPYLWGIETAPRI